MAILKKLINPNVFAGAANSWDSTPTAYDSPNPAPDDAMTPPTNARSGVSLSPAFNPNTSGQPDVVKDIYQPQLRDINSRLQEAYNPPQLGVGGTLRHIAGSLFARRNPQLGAIISGDYGRLQNINALTKQYGLTEDAINQARTQQAQDITNRLHNAQADYFEQRPDLMNKPKQTPDELAFQDYLGKINPKTNKNYTASEARAQMAQDVQDTKPSPEEGTAITDLSVGGQNHKVLVNKKTGAPIKDLGVSKLPTEKPNPVETTFDKANAEQVSKDLTTARGADFRLRSMNSSYKDALNGDQQAMLNLLTNHIGMTLGLQKGARITKDILHEATASAPWLQTVAAKFDDNGYLSGVVLTKGQMDSMMNLAHSQRHTAWQQAHDSASQAGLTDKVQWPSDFTPDSGVNGPGISIKGNTITTRSGKTIKLED